MLASLGLVMAVAQAHPFDSALTGQQLTMYVGQGRLRVDYLVEVPARDAVRWLVEERRNRPDDALEDIESDVISRELSSYADGLRLVVDGESRRWTRLEPPEDSGTGDERFVRFLLALEVPLDGKPHALHVSNGNLPDRATLFFVDVRVDDWIVIDESSLLTPREEGGLRDLGGDWRGDEELRELRLAVRSRTPATHRLLGLLETLSPPPGELPSPWRTAASAHVSELSLGLPARLLPLLAGAVGAVGLGLLAFLAMLGRGWRRRAHGGT